MKKNNLILRHGFLYVWPINDFNTDSAPSRPQWSCFPSALAARGLGRPHIRAVQLLAFVARTGQRIAFPPFARLLN